MPRGRPVPGCRRRHLRSRLPIIASLADSRLSRASPTQKKKDSATWLVTQDCKSFLLEYQTPHQFFHHHLFFPPPPSVLSSTTNLTCHPSISHHEQPVKAGNRQYMAQQQKPAHPAHPRRTPGPLSQHPMWSHLVCRFGRPIPPFSQGRDAADLALCRWTTNCLPRCLVCRTVGWPA